MVNSPVAIFIFNRPEFTQILIDVLLQVGIKHLLVIADGPRSGIDADIDSCNKARSIVDSIDWGCKVDRLYRDENLGCGHGPSMGLDWVFSQVDRCIILEDDCIPDPSFFQYCDELLDRYFADSRIMMISGDNYLLNKHQVSDSYFFTINTQTHGWATWRRAWDMYDFYMSDWPAIRSSEWLTVLLGDRGYANSWIKNLDYAYRESNQNPKCSFWDYQWKYTCWKNSALNICPAVNLISNIGYGDFGTHTHEKRHALAALSSSEISFPLRHPAGVIRDYIADQVLKETGFGYRPIHAKILRKIRSILAFD